MATQNINNQKNSFNWHYYNTIIRDSHTEPSSHNLPDINQSLEQCNINCRFHYQRVAKVAADAKVYIVTSDVVTESGTGS